MHPVEFELLARDGAARSGIGHAAKGSYRTPCFMPSVPVPRSSTSPPLTTNVSASRSCSATPTT